MESLPNDKRGKLDGKIGASESNLSAQITKRFDSLRSEMFTLQQENDYLKTKISDTEDAIEELENETERLRKTVEKEHKFRNDLEQLQRRDSLRFLGEGPDRGRETADDCEEKILAIINDDLGLNHILSAIMDDAAAGSAPVLDIEMSEVLAPPDNVERRSTRVHRRAHDSAGVAASTPMYDRCWTQQRPPTTPRETTTERMGTSAAFK